MLVGITLIGFGLGLGARELSAVYRARMWDDAAPRDVVIHRDSGATGWSLFPITLLMIGGLVCYHHVPRPRERRRALPDGGVELEQRNKRGSWVVLAGAGALTLLPGGLSTDVVAALAGIATTIGFVYLLLAYLTRLRVATDRSRAVAGDRIRLAASVVTPFTRATPHAELVGRERCTWQDGSSPRIDLREFHRVAASDGTIGIPDDAVPSFDAREIHIEWLIEVSEKLPWWPDLAVQIPIAIEPRTTPPGSDVLPAQPRSGTAAIVLDRADATFEPGELIGGMVQWQRDTAPQRATVVLAWTATSPHARDTGIAGTLDVAELPVLDDAVDYRGSAERPAVALRARDRRRLRLDAPRVPYSYSGELIAVTWELRLELGDERETFGVTIGRR